MSTVVVGAGPTGMFLAMSLVRRGHRVTIVDRDGGPDPSLAPNDFAISDGRPAWQRKGVMQFHHPHFFRPQVRDALSAELPDVDEALLDAGALLTPVAPGMPEVQGYRVRRFTFERVMRAALARESGVDFVVGHADAVAHDGRRLLGAVVDGALKEADLLIDASGRAGRFADGLRAPAVGGDTGFAYVSRQYQLLPGAEPGPLNGPPGWGGIHDGYLVIVFLQDAGTFQTLIVRRSEDAELAKLRDPALFDVVARAIPSIAVWIDPARSKPVTPVLVGGGLHNTYRGQLTETADVAVNGLVFVGDAVLTTNPAAGRGVTTSIMQARRLLELIDANGPDHALTTREFDQWCSANMKPWWRDHVEWDAGLISRWLGADVDFDRPLPSDLICSAGEVDPSLMPLIGAFWAMFVLPDALQQIEPRARELLIGGHRPKAPEGPTRDDLAALIVEHEAAA